MIHRDSCGAIVSEVFSRKRAIGVVERYGVTISADKWAVYVCEEVQIARPDCALAPSVAEFWLKILNRICQQLALPVFVGTHRMGERVGSGESLEHFCKTALKGWASWSEEHQRTSAPR